MSEVSNPTTSRVLTNISRAAGMAHALAHPLPGPISESGVKEVAAEIVFLLNRAREELLKGMNDG